MARWSLVLFGIFLIVGLAWMTRREWVIGKLILLQYRLEMYGLGLKVPAKKQVNVVVGADEDIRDQGE